MQPHILYAVLNWGLGHATRSIPLITTLIRKGFRVSIASDGLALEFLKKEFASLHFLALPALNITYKGKGNQAIALLFKSPEYAAWLKRERIWAREHFKHHHYSGIISDNRPTINHQDTPGVYLTHQLHIKAGLLSSVASKMHQQFYKEFKEVWIPDYPEEPGISGKLGHNHQQKNTKYIGPLSDLAPRKELPKYDLAILLSGPEPQRTMLENNLVNQLSQSQLEVMLMRGSNSKPETSIPSTWHVINIGLRADVQACFEKARIIIARSGYSTLMDLAHFPKPAILIPTPGQPEQEYLASMNSHQTNFEIQNQANLNIAKGIPVAIEKAKNHQLKIYQPDWDGLLSVFKSE